ncbi:uncharacterized protein LOC134287463 [Aedes albopictus]|uniref:Reverse transcriptase domain-containing protein n=1 Tax=Aedes albopictus TaxID=7160 RepID=A0ABM2A1G8_AEDAL
MVVMYIADYDRKMSTLLDDSTYKVLPKDPTSKFQWQNNTLVRRLSNLELIDHFTASRLTSKTATCPRIYGQPKAHKDGLPLRPVVPNITAPTYQLSKYIASVLSKGFKSEYNIIDSFSFVKYTTAVTLPAGYILVSFDVVSLFTNIPKDLVIRDIIMNWDTIGKATNINLDLFLEMVSFCIDSSYFKFRDKFYQQTFGTAMGSPLSPILAEVVMEVLLRTVTKRLSFPLPVIKKYVDDLFVALPEDQIEHTLQIFNSYNQHLQFTVEKEADGRLPFLDTLVIRNPDQTISTQWYSKPISSGRLLNFHSFHPISMKINVAANFIKRVTLLTTNLNQQQQSNIIFHHLRSNNYPSSLINRLLCRAKPRASITEVPHDTPTTSNVGHLQELNEENHPHAGSITSRGLQTPLDQNTPAIQPQQRSPPSTTNGQQLTEYRSIPFIENLSPTIANILKADFPQVRIAYKTLKNTNNILRSVKDPLPLLDQCNVIYSLECTDCKQTYIGMTTNQLKTRMSGHKSNVNQYTKLIQSNDTHTNEEILRLGEKNGINETCH